MSSQFTQKLIIIYEILFRFFYWNQDSSETLEYIVFGYCLPTLNPGVPWLFVPLTGHFIKLIISLVGVLPASPRSNNSFVSCVF